MNQENYQLNLNKLNRYLKQYEKRHINKFGTPFIFSFLVTNRCNLKCKHCFYHETIDSGAEQELTIDEYRKLSSSMENFMTGIFCGGEPFIRDDFYEIIQIFHKNNNMMQADSASNGQLTERIVSQVEKILQFAPNQGYSLGISLDGIKETHNKIRGEGSFEKAIVSWKELKLLKKHYSNFELYICTTMNTINELSMDEFIKYAIAELKPDKISLIKTRQHPRAGETIKNINLENYLNCVKLIEESRSNLDSSILEKPQTYLLPSVNNYIYDGEKLGKKLFQCYAGLHGGFIDYNGEVGLCEVLPSVGNLRNYDMDFLKLWNDTSAMQQRKCVNEAESCKYCTHESEGLLPSLYFYPNSIKYDRVTDKK